MPKMKLASSAHPPSVPSNLYTVDEIARESGLTLRQLQTWDESRILRSVKVDGRRTYSPQQVTLATRLRQLRDARVALSQLRSCAALPWTSIKVVRVHGPVLVGNVLVVASGLIRLRDGALLRGTTYASKREKGRGSR